jgi:cell shape-determining protein MreC
MEVIKMSTELMIIIACYIIAVVVAIVLFKSKKEEPKVVVPSNEYSTLMEILDSIIQREIQYKNTLDYKVKDIRVIYNFQEDLKELTTKILTSLSEPFFQELEYYHSREYIIRYVTRYVEAFLIQFTRQNKIKTK